MKRQPKFESEIGFEEWGDYMGAKISKLEEQFRADQESSGLKRSNLFEGISIFVNGYTKPSSEELKRIMIQHGGVFHHYKRSHTTYTIASNLPDVKVRQITSEVIISPQWVVDCVEKGRIVDYKKYLLYTEHKPSQPKLNFTLLPDKQEQDCDKETSVSPDLFESSDDDEKETISKSEPKQKVTKSAADPDFLSEFFQNSRLHHISTLGAGFKQHISDLRENHDKNFPDRENLLYLPKTNNSQGRKIMHIDMDCFFVSVGLRKHPHLKGVPLAVTHSKGSEAGKATNRPGVDRKQEIELYHKRLGEKYESNKNVESRLSNIDNHDSLSEIASCSYEAREKGVKNGMFVGAALKICPNLKTIPYDFEGYRNVAYNLYNTVAKYTLDIEAVSCDEMFVDLSDLLAKTNVECMEFVKFLRNEIKSITGCPCSAGVGSNRLQARLATKKAKPDGQYYLSPEIVEEYMKEIQIADLPGVGKSTTYRLNQLNLKFCRDLQSVSLIRLQQEFGKKFGENLYQACRGIDDKPLIYEQDRKSVSVEINYGIRFTHNEQVERFLNQLCEEVQSRLLEARKKGKNIALKLLVRSKDAPIETAKYMGHGVCDQFNKSVALTDYTNDLAVIQKSIINLFRNFNFPPNELRGIGIHISKLDEKRKEKPQGNAIQDMFNKAKEKVKAEPKIETIVNVGSTKHEDDQRKMKLENNDNKNSLLNMFQNQKDKKFDAKNFNFDEIDPDFLLALPDDIRNEIIEQHLAQIATKTTKTEQKTPKKRKYRKKSKTSEQKLLKIEHRTPERGKIEEKLNSIDLQWAKTEQKTPEKTKFEIPFEPIDLPLTKVPEKEEKSAISDNIFAQPNWDSLLLAWIESTHVPEQCDIDIIAENAMKFAEEKQIFDLYPALRYIFRKIDEKKECNWHRAYFKIIEQVQCGMSRAYTGKRLSVLTDFNCDKNCVENFKKLN